VSISVAIVEDNAGICEELQQILSTTEGFTCSCVCRNAQSADVVIMDVQLPDGSGVECTAALKPGMPETQFLIYTVCDDSEHVFEALKAGAVGYLLKDSKPEELVAGLREVANGGSPMTGEIARKVISSFHRTAPLGTELEKLTHREEEILELFAQGLLCKEAAARLGISLETVNTHRKSIYRKLQVRSRTEAVVKYLK
jgi:DNA-binding NarL/FixJ family response regulator